MERINHPDPLPLAVRRSALPVDVFNPLLRSLLSWDLVHRVDCDDGTHDWRLTDATQRQLDELTPPRRRDSGSLVYLDHWCARCRQQRLTHLLDGRYLCEECEQIEASGRTAPAEAARSRGHHLQDLHLRPKRPGHA
jgi:hypothetical protein